MKSSLAGANHRMLTNAAGDEIGCSGLAKIFGLSEQRIGQLVKEGMPRNARGQYSLAECAAFYVAFLRRQLEERKSDTIVSERLRLVRAKAKIAEIDADMAEGGVLDIAKARQEIMALSGEIREGLMGLPGRCAHELVGLDVGQIKTRLSDLVSEALNHVADRLEKHGDELSSSRSGRSS